MIKYFVIFLLIGLTKASINKIGSEFQVNTNTLDSQEYASVTLLADGKFVITWSSLNQDGSKWGIFAQMYNDDGTKYGTEFQVNSNTFEEQKFSSITGLTDGKFVITWQSLFQDGSFLGIYAQIFNNDGTPFGTEFKVNTFITGDQGDPVISSLSDGKFVITWESRNQDGSFFGIYAQMYNNDGTIFGTEFQVNSYTTDRQRNPYICSLTNNKFVITWESLGQDRNLYGIFAQIFNNDGTFSGSEFQVNTYTTSQQEKPCVTGLSDSKFVITWESFNQIGEDYEVFAQIFNNDGTKYGSEFQVNTYTISSQRFPFVTDLSNSKFIITWESYFQDGNSNGIYGKIYNNDGTVFESEFQVNTYTLNGQDTSSINKLTNNKFIVTWQSSGQDSNGYGVFAQLYECITSPPIEGEMCSDCLPLRCACFLCDDGVNYGGCCGTCTITNGVCTGYQTCPALPPTESPMESPDNMCSTGILAPGTSGVCCSDTCGTCGGSGCSQRDGGKENCCIGVITESGRYCDEVGPPCVVRENLQDFLSEEWSGTCNNPDSKGERCCDDQCGQCGGSGCGAQSNLLDGTTMFANERCCVSGIESLNRVCSPGIGPPCVIQENVEDFYSETWDGTCNNPDTKNKRCCDDQCDICTGSGCGSSNNIISGSTMFVNERCCASGIQSLNRICGPTVGPPCLIPQTSRKMLFV